MKRCSKCGTHRRTLNDGKCTVKHVAMCHRRAQTWPARRKALAERKPAKA